MQRGVPRAKTETRPPLGTFDRKGCPVKTFTPRLPPRHPLPGDAAAQHALRRRPPGQTRPFPTRTVVRLPASSPVVCFFPRGFARTRASSPKLNFTSKMLGAQGKKKRIGMEAGVLVRKKNGQAEPCLLEMVHRRGASSSIYIYDPVTASLLDFI